MNDNAPDIQQALKDIALIRRVLNQSDRDATDAKLVGVTLDANLILQMTAFIVAFALSVVEIFGGNSMSITLNSGAQNRDLMTFGVGLMGTIIAGLVVVLYFILWRAARHNGEEFGTYVTRNFRYVQNLSLVSDLLMKFATLSLLLLAGKPQWIAPALLAFTGDYLLQGRLFTLSTKLGVALGTICVAGAFAQFLANSALLVIPLLAFTAIAGISVGRLALRYRQQSTASA
jgi:hypothetical protein